MIIENEQVSFNMLKVSTSMTQVIEIKPTCRLKTIEYNKLPSRVPRWLFLSQFRPLLKQARFFEATGAVDAKIFSSVKLNHHWQI